MRKHLQAHIALIAARLSRTAPFRGLHSPTLGKRCERTGRMLNASGTDHAMLGSGTSRSPGGVAGPPHAAADWRGWQSGLVASHIAAGSSRNSTTAPSKPELHLDLPRRMAGYKRWGAQLRTLGQTFRTPFTRKPTRPGLLHISESWDQSPLATFS